MRRPVVATPPATDSTCDLVFLHGFLGTPTEWLALLDRLPAAWRQRCHCLTLPGHGPEAPDAMPWPQLADWLDHELARRQIRRAVLYGYSLGGRLAFSLLPQLADLLRNMLDLSHLTARRGGLLRVLGRLPSPKALANATFGFGSAAFQQQAHAGLQGVR